MRYEKKRVDQKIAYLFRKPDPAFNSIEKVFSSIIPEVGKQCHTRVLALPCPSGFWGVLKNLLSFRKQKNTIWHITGQDFYMALRTGRNTVLTIHDVGSALNGNRIKSLFIRIFWFWLPALIAGKITVISEFSKGELERLVPFAKKKIRVIHNPVPPDLKYSPKEFNSERPVILLMGTKSNKNLERMVESLQHISCHLIIAGKLSLTQNTILNVCNFRLLNSFHPESPDRNDQPQKTKLKSPDLPDYEERDPDPCWDNLSEEKQDDIPSHNPQPKIQNTYITFHSLTYPEIISLYEICDMVCFASTYEGFGLPILEAQATGRPVVTSNIASMPEVAASGACLVDPCSVGSIREGVLKVVSNAPYREMLIRNGLKNLERFSTEKIAAKYMEVYEEFGKVRSKE